tara:strand:+ start:49 stop:1617 length:1569 start_codon:yes stop_codon:yes gene_type:complete
MSKLIKASLNRYKIPEFKPDWGNIRRGIEKECLRVSPAGQLSTRRHPAALGSALTNPYITTDFSEALLEFITPAYADIKDCLDMLENIHRFSLENLEEQEMLWVCSMPCPLNTDSEIPIARYGSSNIGRMKALYRSGLHHRYGSLMQIIAGLHYNFSMPDSFWQPFKKICGDQQSLMDFKTSRYLHLIRNFHRFSWLLIYLFGASPAACKCFAQGRQHSLLEFDDHSLYLPHATCLRMGKLGYKSEAQNSLFVCYNELDAYVECLNNAMHTPYPDYEAISRSENNGPVQINANLLQLENEFYSTIRPKRNVPSGTKPLNGLIKEGIEYVEIRALDLNPFLPMGINSEQIKFVDSFLLHCLLSESPQCNQAEFFEVANNVDLVVEHGRDPDLALSRAGRAIPMREWAESLLDDIDFSCALLNYCHPEEDYGSALEAQRAKVSDSELTPSGKILKEMRENDLSFFEFSTERSKVAKKELLGSEMDSGTLVGFITASKNSLKRQAEIEGSDTLEFESYLAEWNNS